jgi:hypothetical protein
VVGKGVGKCRCFGSTLGGMKIARVLHDLAELSICVCQTWMRLLCCKSCQLVPEIRLGDTKSCGSRSVTIHDIRLL